MGSKTNWGVASRLSRFSRIALMKYSYWPFRSRASYRIRFKTPVIHWLNSNIRLTRWLKTNYKPLLQLLSNHSANSLAPVSSKNSSCSPTTPTSLKRRSYQRGSSTCPGRRMPWAAGRTTRWRSRGEDLSRKEARMEQARVLEVVQARWMRWLAGVVKKEAQLYYSSKNSR